MAANVPSAMRAPDLALVIPCYNEADRLDPDAFLRFVAGRPGARLVMVDDAQVAAAMRLLFRATHNVAEGAGAAALAAAYAERERVRGQRIGLVLTGGNVDADVFARVLADSAND